MTNLEQKQDKLCDEINMPVTTQSETSLMGGGIFKPNRLNRANRELAVMH